MSIKSIVEFEYYTPNTVEEAVTLLSQFGEHAKVIAGGTDLIPKMKSQVAVPKQVVSLKQIDELKYLTFDETKGLEFGAGVPIRRVECFAPVKKYFPALYEGAHNIASTQIRNAGTLVGNVCNAVPSADSAPGMLVLDAVVHIASVRGRRDVPIHEFFTGVCKTVVAPDELVTGITIPVQPEHSKSMYLPFTVRRALDLAMVGAAANVTVEGGVCTEIKLALGAVAATPRRAYHAEAVLRGQEPTAERIEQAAAVASEEDCAPITDLRATKEYRKELVRVLTRDAIKACL